MPRNIKFFTVCFITMIIMKYLLPIGGEPVFREVLISSGISSFFITLFYIYLNRWAAKRSSNAK